LVKEESAMIYADIGIGKLFYILDEGEVNLLLLVVEDMTEEDFQGGADFKCFILFDRFGEFEEDNEFVYIMHDKEARQELVHDVKSITEDSRRRYASNLSAEDYRTEKEHTEEFYIYMQMSYQHFYLRFSDFEYDHPAQPITSPTQYHRLLEQMVQDNLITLSESHILKELEVLLPRGFNIAQSPRLSL